MKKNEREKTFKFFFVKLKLEPFKNINLYINK